MTNLPLISICVPIYNVGKYIERCARSLFGQTYQNIEYIFVDDSSPDDSVLILENIIQELNADTRRIKILHHIPNRGLAAARNTAIVNATGEFVIHVDSDDWIECNAVELLVKRQLETKADIVSCNGIAHHPNGVTKLLIEPRYNSLDEMVMQTIQLTLDHVIWRRLIRKSLYTENGIQAVEGVNIGEDHHTLPRLVYCAKSFACIEECLWHYNCENENSYMQQSQGFNYKRYKSDSHSINILLEFFEKEHRYYDELQKIKVCHVNSSLKMALNASDKDSYNKMLNDLYTIPSKYLIHAQLNNAWRFFMVNNYYVRKWKQIIFNH